MRKWVMGVIFSMFSYRREYKRTRRKLKIDLIFSLFRLQKRIKEKVGDGFYILHV